MEKSLQAPLLHSVPFQVKTDGDFTIPKKTNGIPSGVNRFDQNERLDEDDVLLRIEIRMMEDMHHAQDCPWRRNRIASFHK